MHCRGGSYSPGKLTGLFMGVVEGLRGSTLQEQEHHWVSRTTSRHFQMQHVHSWSWRWTPDMEEAGRLKALHRLHCRAESRLILSSSQKKKKKSGLTGCQKLVKILLRKTQPHLSGIKGNLLSTSVGCGSSAGILHSLSPQHTKTLRISAQKKKKNHPPTNDSWRHSGARVLSAGFVTLLPLAWQRTDTSSELWYQLWSAFTNASKPLLSVKQEGYNQPIFHHTNWQQWTPLGTEWYWWSMIVFLEFVSKRDNIQCCLSSVLSDGVRPDQVFI